MDGLTDRPFVVPRRSGQHAVAARATPACMHAPARRAAFALPILMLGLATLSASAAQPLDPSGAGGYREGWSTVAEASMGGLARQGPHAGDSLPATGEWAMMDGMEADHAEGVDSGNLTQGAIWSYTFPSEEVFVYHCHPHPFMTGRVTVASDPSARSGTVQVAIAGYAFQPQNLTVRPGTTVRWTNQDPVVHTVSEEHDGHGHDAAAGQARGAWAVGFGPVLAALAVAAWQGRGSRPA